MEQNKEENTAQRAQYPIPIEERSG